MTFALLTNSLHADMIILDHFDDGTLDPAWTINFDNATGWAFSEAGTNLTVTDITAPVSSAWNYVRLNQTFTPLTDFDVSFNFSWDSGGSNGPVQVVFVSLLDPDGVGIGGGGYHDAWVASSGEKSIGGFRSGAGSLPLGGLASVDISRVGGDIEFRWDDALLASTFNTSALAGIQIEFAVHTGGTFFGTESVDLISVQGTIPEPSTYLLFLMIVAGIFAVKRARLCSR